MREEERTDERGREDMCVRKIQQVREEERTGGGRREYK